MSDQENTNWTKRPPTNVSSSHVSTPLVETKKIVLDEIKITGGSIKELSHDINDTSPEHAPSSAALSRFRSQVNANFQSLNVDLESRKVTPVISPELMPSYFTTNSKWKVKNINYSAGKAIFTNKQFLPFENQASLDLNTDVITSVGDHYIRIIVSNITSGSLDLVNDVGDILLSITEPGIYEDILYVSDPNKATIRFIINNVDGAETIVIDRIYLYHVEDRATQYFTYLSKQQKSDDGSKIASVNWVLEKLNENNASLINQVNNIVDKSNQTLMVHLTASNPHRITAESINAANKKHTHTPDECGAAPINHTHTADELGIDISDHTHPELEALIAACNTNLANAQLRITDNSDAITKIALKVGQYNSLDELINEATQNLSNRVTELTTRIDNLVLDDEERLNLTNNINNISTTISDLQSQVIINSSNIETNYNLILQAMYDVASAKNTATNYNSTVNTNKTNITNLTTKITNIEKSLSEIETSIENSGGLSDEDRASITKAVSDASSAISAATSASTKADNAMSAANEASTAASTASTDASSASTLASSVKTDLDNYKTEVSNKYLPLAGGIMTGATRSTIIEMNDSTIININNGATFQKSISSDTVFTILAASGSVQIFNLIIANGGNNTVTWPQSIKWANGSVPSLTVDGTDVLTFISIDAGTTWYGSMSISAAG